MIIQPQSRQTLNTALITHNQYFEIQIILKLTDYSLDSIIYFKH